MGFRFIVRFVTHVTSQVFHPEDITAASLALFHMIHPKIGIVIFEFFLILINRMFASVV